MSTYDLTPFGLSIPDPEAFGFDGPTLPDGFVGFDLVEDDGYRVVLRHEETGRCFSAPYVGDDPDGFRWDRVVGRDDDPPCWSEVLPEEQTVIVYRAKPPGCRRCAKDINDHESTAFHLTHGSVVLDWPAGTLCSRCDCAIPGHVDRVALRKSPAADTLEPAALDQLDATAQQPS